MIARFLRAFALWLGLYGLLTAAHFGVLWGLDQLRQRLENRLESRYGTEAVDREPPYSWGERVVLALDVQPSPYWQESLGVSALLSLPVALLTGAAALFVRRARRAALMAIAIVGGILLMWLLTQLGGLALAGYLVGNPTAAVVEGALIGLIQGMLAILVLAPSRR